jgi:D-alanine-D-alanine ligase-like ATP-grasp enzyme
MAHFKLIGWDMAVDENNEPVFIEYNTFPGANQLTNGPAFGDLTEKVLEEYFINRTLANAQN